MFSLVEIRGVNFPDDGDDAGVELGGELGLGDDGGDPPDLLLGHAVVAVLVIKTEYDLEGKQMFARKEIVGWKKLEIPRALAGNLPCWHPYSFPAEMINMMCSRFQKNTHTGKEEQKIKSNLPLPECQQVILVCIKSPDKNIYLWSRILSTKTLRTWILTRRRCWGTRPLACRWCPCTCSWTPRSRGLGRCRRAL